MTANSKSAASLRYQQRMRADPGPAGEAFRAKRREIDERRNKKRRAKRGASDRTRIVIPPKRLSIIELIPPAPVLMTSQEWEKLGGEVERLPNKLGMPYIGLDHK